MAKMSLNMTRKFKITDFLLGFGFRSRRRFCRYCYVTWVYRFSYMYVKRSLRALRWISYRWRCRSHFATPTSETHIQMCSGLDSYRTCEVWGRSNIVWLSYNNIYSHGETSKFERTPRTRPPMKTLDLRNLTSQRALDCNDQFWCSSE